MTEVNVFDDSQASGQSADLFEDVGGRTNNVLKEVLTELKQLRKDIAELKGCVRSNSLTGTNPFTMEKCAFKKHLNAVMKRDFSIYAWLQTDEEFKTMVQRYLAEEGYRGNMGAVKTVVAYATTKFTEFRNQLRRKIMGKLIELKTMHINALCHMLFDQFTPIGEDTCLEERIQYALVIIL